MPDEITQFGPEWYSGGGKRKSDIISRSFRANPEIARAIREKAAQLRMSPQEFRQFIDFKWGEGGLGHSQVDAGSIMGISPDETNRFLDIKRYDPEFAKELANPYEKEPGALKYIADLGRGHLGEKARVPFTQYAGPRIAEFEGPQTEAHQAVQRMARDTGPKIRHQNILDTSAAQRRGPGAMGSMEPHLTKGTSQIGEAERNPFVDSVRQNVLKPLQEEMTENLMENILPRINANRIAAGNLRGGMRTKLQERALKDLNKILARETGSHLYQAQLHGQTAAEHERERHINAAQLAGNVRGRDLERQIEGAKAEQGLMGEQQQRELTGLEALSNVGSQQQKLKQQKYELDYQDFLSKQEGIMPHLERYNAVVRGMAVPQTRASFTPQVPEPHIMSQLGGLGLMASGALFNKKNAYKGGRIMLASGGMAQGGVGDSLNIFKDKLNSMMTSLRAAPSSMAGQQVQDNMIDQMMPDQGQPEGMMQSPPPPPSGPIEKGAHGALGALEKMNQHRAALEQQAGSYESGAEDVNPWGRALMHLGAGLAGGNPKFSERLGEGAKGALSGFEQAEGTNQQNKIISQNIRKSLLDTYQKEHENDLKMQQTKELAQIKASGKAPKMYYNKKTGTHYTLDENGQMIVAPGAPAPVTPEEALKAKGSELRMSEEIKGEQANVNKLREIANKSQASIGNYGTVKRLLEESGVSKYMGPIKGKFFQNPKVQALMSGKGVTSIQEFNGAINKVVLDDIKMMGANPSDRDVRIVENSKPSPTDTPEGALRKALINEAAQRRMQDFANFTNEMWSKHGIKSFESQKAFNEFMQDNPQFNEHGDVILKPHSKPEDYLDNDSRLKAGLDPVEEKEKPEEEAFEDVSEPIKSHGPSKLTGNEEEDKAFAKKHLQQIRAAKILKMAGST